MLGPQYRTKFNKTKKKSSNLDSIVSLINDEINGNNNDGLIEYSILIDTSDQTQEEKEESITKYSFLRNSIKIQQEIKTYARENNFSVSFSTEDNKNLKILINLNENFQDLIYCYGIN